MSFSDELGLEVDRFDAILAKLNTRISVNTGKDVDTSADSLVGHLHTGYAHGLAEANESLQGIDDATDLLAAEDTGLNNLGILAGKTRGKAKQSYGIADFTGSDGTPIPSGSRVRSIRQDFFITKSAFTISPSSCVTARLYVGVLQNATIYRVDVNGVRKAFTSDADATYTEILQGLQALIDTEAGITATFVLDSVEEAASYVLIDKDDKGQGMTIYASTYLTFDHVTTSWPIFSEEYGLIPGDALAINEVINKPSGWYSVINRVDLALGSDLETNEEFRDTILNDYGTTGAGTPDATLRDVKAVEGVINAFINENDTNATVNGVGPWGHEVIVHGGNDVSIAGAIWINKSNGLTPYGTTSVTIQDFNGYDKTVSFTRPSVKYVTIKVDYTLYDEETFAADAVDTAKAAMLLYATNNLTITDDIIAKRFLGAIYDSTDGFDDITITVAYKDAAGDVVSGGDYADRLAISLSQVPSFALDRMIFTEV